MLDKIVIASALSAGMLSARPFVLGWDESFAFASHSSGQGFDRTPGDLEVSDYQIRALYPRPVVQWGSFSIQPAVDYRATVFQFNNVPTSIPVDKNHLESFNVYPSTLEFSALALSIGSDSRWMFGAWVMSGLATDFRNVDADDLTFDFATGVGYRFSDSLSAGFGAALTDLSAETGFLPGIGLDWQVSDRIRIGICGPSCGVTFSPDENWQISLRGDSSGETWNITDGQGQSRYLDFTSYKIGLFASRRLTGQIRLSAGAGVTFANQIGLARSNGDTLLEQRLDSGFFGQIGLTLTTW